MATHESFQESSDPIKYKKLVLRVSIDCEGCRKRVNKILTKVPGVQEVDINLKQQKVTVIGDVDVVILLKKLRKSGRQVELLPEIKPETMPETVTLKQPGKNRDKGKQPKVDNKEESSRSGAGGFVNDDKLVGKRPQQDVKAQASEDHATSSKTTGGESAESSANSGDKNGGVSASEEAGREEGSKESKKSEPENESKSEGKKPAGEEPPLAAEKKDVQGENSTAEKVDSGIIVKKKKKGGQNGNNKSQGLSSSVSDAATDNGVVLPNYSLPANNVLPRDLNYYRYPPDLYTSPPVYAASYNTSHASSSTTTSYYAQQPADSYVYAYSGPAREPPPSDFDAYNRQPLDSLEMFSDENPNGCSIM